jgi:hypothetical protein
MVTDFKSSRSVTLRLQDKLWKLKFGRNGELMPAESQYPKGHSISEIREAFAIISTVLKDYHYLINDLIN